ncbi:MAG: rhodanese-like domain-containing protein [Bacilli bacterium]|nr:rhodanese-like domain-containing protein [Bacilli bacterium]
MKKFLILILGLTLCGCINTSDKENLKTLMKENEYVIIDVRTEEEYLESHVSDAINIPYNKISENVDIDKNTVIFVYCKSGARSEVAFDALADLGYEVYNLGAFSEIDLPKE